MSCFPLNSISSATHSMDDLTSIMMAKLEIALIPLVVGAYISQFITIEIEGPEADHAIGMQRECLR
jgi:hypothetical protein